MHAGKNSERITLLHGFTHVEISLKTLINPILHGLNPCVVSMSNFCAYLAWPHFFSGIPRDFLIVSKQLHIRALSKCSFNFQPNSSVAEGMMNSFLERS